MSLDHAIGAVLFNASNFPPAVQSRLLGQDMWPLRQRLMLAVKDALLSDEAVERAAYAMYLDRPLELDQEGGDDWAILPDEWKYEWSEGARAALEGALGVHESTDPGSDTNHTNRSE